MNKNVKIENINLNDKDYLLNKIYSDELLEKIILNPMKNIHYTLE